MKIIIFQWFCKVLGVEGGENIDFSMVLEGFGVENIGVPFVLEGFW